MRHTVSVLTLIACAALTAHAADDEKYTSKEGKYKVRFPKGAKVETESKKSGESEMFFAVTNEGMGKAFAVVYLDHTFEKGTSPKSELDRGEMNLVKMFGAELKTSTDFTFGPTKILAREFVMDREGNQVRTRMILTGTRAYMVLVCGTKDVVTSKESLAFLDSFEIIK